MPEYSEHLAIKYDLPDMPTSTDSVTWKRKIVGNIVFDWTAIVDEGESMRHTFTRIDQSGIDTFKEVNDAGSVDPEKDLSRSWGNRVLNGEEDWDFYWDYYDDGRYRRDNGYGWSTKKDNLVEGDESFTKTFYDFKFKGEGFTTTYDDVVTLKFTIRDTTPEPTPAPVPTPSPEPPKGYSKVDGYGQVNAQKAFELLLDIELPNVNDLGGTSWPLDMINVPEVWRGTGSFGGASGKGVTVAVIDTGVDLDHPEFKGRIVDGYDFVDDDKNADDPDGHGTHVAGTIAGARDNRGVTGVAYQSNIMPIRVLGKDGGSARDVISGIYWAVENGADVINLSLGGGSFDRAYLDSIEHASAKGVVVVMAAGNEYKPSPSYPAAYASHAGIAVGAINNRGEMPAFSNEAGSKKLDYITAPGVGIYSAIPNGSYAESEGTSMAAPHIAGVAALLKDADKSLSANEIENLLTYSSSNGREGAILKSALPEAIPLGNEVITKSNYRLFARDEVTDPLIINFSGKAKKRQKSFDKLDNKITQGKGVYSLVEEFEIIDSTNHQMGIIDLNDDLKSDPYKTIGKLLKGKAINYLQVEQTFDLI